MSPVRMEKIETAVRVVLQLSEAFNRHDTPAMQQFLNGDPLLEPLFSPPDGETIQGKATIARYWQAFFDRSPLAHLEVEDVFGYGFRCVLLWRYTWVDAADAPNSLRGVTVFKLKDGLITHISIYRK